MEFPFPKIWQDEVQEKTAGIFQENAGKQETRSTMDCVMMVLMERDTGLPLDLVIFINSFLIVKITDGNLHEAIALWCENEEECKIRFGHISDWNTSRVTNMSGAFYARRNFNEDISGWDLGNVKSTIGMFYEASQFNGDIGQWNVSKVRDMEYMFAEASQFNRDISQWNVSQVTDMSCMFAGASQFNGDISQWDVRSVISLNFMFHEATEFSGDISQWDVSNATDRNYVFSDETPLTRLILDTWSLRS
jgi:surface protein